MAILVDSVLPPLVAIFLKWIIIGRYIPGTYRMYVFLVIPPTNLRIEYGIGGPHTIYDGGSSIKF